MAEVMVFVDDAVLGRLPDVCARDGVPARGRLSCTLTVGGSSQVGVVWLLLLLAFPIGWVVALYLLFRNDGEELSIELPYGDAAYERLVVLRRRRRLGLLAGVGGGLALLLATAQLELGDPGLLLAGVVLVAGLAVAGAATVGQWRERVDLGLDASRRWVTLQGVHPAFARACESARDRTDA